MDGLIPVRQHHPGGGESPPGLCFPLTVVGYVSPDSLADGLAPRELRLRRRRR